MSYSSRFIKFLSLCSLVVFFMSACGSSDGNKPLLRVDTSNASASGTDGVGFKWAFNLNASFEPKNDADPFEDIDSSPAIGDDGTIYIGSKSRYLYAILPNGKIKWAYETGGTIDGSPAIGSDGTIYVGSVDRQVYAINPDGSLKWVYPTKSIFTSSPAIGADGIIYIGGNFRGVYICPEGRTLAVTGILYALHPSGILLWTVPLSASEEVNNLGGVHSSPVIAADGTIYIGTDGGAFDQTTRCNADSAIPNSVGGGLLYAINSNGSIKWVFGALGDVDSSPAIGIDGTIYVGSDGPGDTLPSTPSHFESVTGYLYAINPNGTLKWLFDAFGDVDSSPAIGSDGTIYFGSDKNDFFALHPDGSIKWIYPTRGDVNSSPAIGSDGTIYVGSNSEFDDDLYAINPDGTVKWRFDTGGFVNSAPAIAPDGTIYIASEDDLLYAIPGSTGLAQTPWPKFRRDMKNNGRQ